MIITILTLFPEVFTDIFSTSILGRAQKKGLLDIRLINIRKYGIGTHAEVDDKPYGGGVGMVMRVDVLERAIAGAKCRPEADRPLDEKVILLDPKGKQFNQKKARSYAKLDHLILVCGHYEGVDERVSNFVDEKISIGEYILTGGEIAAMVIVDATVRLLKGVLIRKEATVIESFTKSKEIESPTYTRPKSYKNFEVPKVLLSGDHKKIQEWRIKRQILLK